MIKVCKQSKHLKVLRMFAGLSCLVYIVEGQLDISSTPVSPKLKLPLHFPSSVPSKTDLKPDLDVNELLKSDVVSRSEEKQCKIVQEKFDAVKGYQQQRPSACLNPPLSVITRCGSGVDMVVAASSRGIISWAQYGEWSNYQTSAMLGRSSHAQQLPAITSRTCIYGIAADYPNTKVFVNCLHISPNIKITIGNPTNPIHVQENYDFISKGNFLMIQVDISNNLYFPSFHFNSAFTCIWNSVNY